MLGVLAAALCWLLSHISSRVLDSRLITYGVERKSLGGQREELTYTIKNLTRTVVFTDVGFVVDVEKSNGRIFGNSKKALNERAEVQKGATRQQVEEANKLIKEAQKLAPIFVPDDLVSKAGFDRWFAEGSDTTLHCWINQFHPRRATKLTIIVSEGTEAPLRFHIGKLKPPPRESAKEESEKAETGGVLSGWLELFGRRKGEPAKAEEGGQEVWPVLFQKNTWWTWVVEFEFELTLVFVVCLILAMGFYARFLSRNAEEPQTK